MVEPLRRLGEGPDDADDASSGAPRVDGGRGGVGNGADNELGLRALDQFNESRAGGIIEGDLDACSREEDEGLGEGEDGEGGRVGHGCGGEREEG